MTSSGDLTRRRDAGGGEEVQVRAGDCSSLLVALASPAHVRIAVRLISSPPRPPQKPSAARLSLVSGSSLATTGRLTAWDRAHVPPRRDFAPED
eukprot:185332-Hanusia_phi.AAC.1